MSIEVKGLDEVLTKLQERFNDRKLNKIEKNALNKAGQMAEEVVKTSVSFYRDTGATVDEVVVGKARKRGGENTVRVGWNGPEGRYALVHLNEWGYTRFGKHYNPRGMGKVQAAYDQINKGYKQIIKSVLKEELL